MNNGDIPDFNEGNTTDCNSLKIKEKITGQTGKNGTKNVEIMVPVKYLSNFWRTLEMSLINCEINWSEDYVIVATNVAAESTTFSIIDTKFYVSVVTLSTQDNVKLLEQLKSGFQRTINWSKYQPKVSTERPNQYLDFLIDPIFQGLNKLFVLSFENEAQITSYKTFFDQSVRNNLITYGNIRKIATGQRGDYTTGCLLDYKYFKKYYKMIAIDLSKQQALDADPNAI